MPSPEIPPKTPCVRYTVEVPDDPDLRDQTELALFRLGARLVSSETVFDQPEVGRAEEEARVDYEAYIPPGQRLVGRYALKHYAISKGVSLNWANRATETIFSMAGSGSERDEYISLYTVLSKARRFEAGEGQNYGVGETVWEIIGGLNNSYAISASEVILPWDEIHKDIAHLSRRSPMRKLAIAELSDRYQRYVRLAQSQTKLPRTLEINGRILEIPFE